MQVKARCKAHKRNGEQCGNPPIVGGTVCRMHGGSAPTVRAAAKRRVLVAKAVADAEAVLAHEGVEQVSSPLESLGVLASEVLAFKDALARRVNAIQGELTTRSDLGVEQLVVEIELYERALDRSGKFLDMLVRNGFEEKRVRLAEAQALAVTGALTRTLIAVGITPEQQEQARTILARELRALEGGQA